MLQVNNSEDIYCINLVLLLSIWNMFLPTYYNKKIEIGYNPTGWNRITNCERKKMGAELGCCFVFLVQALSNFAE